MTSGTVCGCAGAWQGGAAAAGGGGAAREDVGAGHQQEEQPRAVRRQGGGQPRQHRVGSPGGQQYNIQLETNVHKQQNKVFTITKAFSWLKAPSNAFTIKTQC